MLLQLQSLISEPLVFVSTIIGVAFLVLYHVRNRGLPPGPTGLPYFGLLFSLTDENNQVKIDEFKEKYGDIFSFTVTGKLYVSFGTVKIMREAYVSHSDCFDRTMDYNMLTDVFGGGVGFVNGERWKVLRKFFTQSFREYGMVRMKETMAGPIYDQVQKTMDDFRASNGEPVKLVSLLTDKCSAIIRETLFGEDGISQKELLDLTEAYFNVAKGLSVTKLLMAGPITRYILFPLISDCRNGLSSHRYMAKILKTIVERHEGKFDENNVRDVIDSFLKERRDRQARNDPSAIYFSNEALVSSLEQFVGDGISAVAYFIASVLLALVEHAEEQDKIYEDIVEVVGTDRHPTMDDKSNLSYTNAYIYEVLRTTNFIAMFPSLECKKEVTINGYRIPKGSMTIINLWLAHHDPLVYEDPHKFDPSRFLSNPGKQRAELPVMFGFGKRSCAGEAFAMMQIFLFLTTTVQNFKVYLPKGVTAASFFDPENMQFVVEPRHKK